MEPTRRPWLWAIWDTISGFADLSGDGRSYSSRREAIAAAISWIESRSKWAPRGTEFQISTYSDIPGQRVDNLESLGDRYVKKSKSSWEEDISREDFTEEEMGRTAKWLRGIDYGG